MVSEFWTTEMEDGKDLGQIRKQTHLNVPNPLVECHDIINVLLLQVEALVVEVVLGTLGVVRFRDDGDTTLSAPAKEYLTR